MKLLIDMNLFPRWAEILAEAGIKAIHWSLLGSPDTDIMMYARNNRFIVLTHDLDFAAILAATQGIEPSVIQIRSVDVSPDVIGKHIIAAVRQMKSELKAGALITVYPKRTRIRVLPLLYT